MRLIILMPFLLITGLLFGCGGGGSSSVPITYQQTPMAVFIYGSVVDAKTAAGIFSSNVTVTGATVYSLSGTALPATIATDSTGQFSVALPKVPVSDITLSIAVTANGYVTNNYSVVVKKDPTVRIYQFQIPLVSLDNTIAPTGVSSSKTTGKTATDTLTVSAATSGASTTVNIDKGTVVRDASGAPLTSNLTLTASAYDSKSDAVRSLAPTDSAVFLTAGFTDISVRDSLTNTAATKLDTPMKVRMDIAAGTINPMTGVAVAKDDVITVFTYKSASGTWEPDTSISTTGEVTVKQDATGLYVEFTADHFSYWNLGFRGTTCTGTINLTSSNGTDHLAGLTFKATGPPAVGTLYTGLKPPGDPTVIMRNVPAAYALTVYAYYGTSTTPVGTTTVAVNCNVKNPMMITLPVTLVTYTWTVQKYCYYQPHETRPVSNVTVWSCPPGTTTLQPYPTCTSVAATDGSGIASVVTSPTNVLFFQPSDAEALPIQSAIASSTPAVINYTSKTWPFCSFTGGSGSIP